MVVPEVVFYCIYIYGHLGSKAGVNRGNLWLFIMVVVFMMCIVAFKTIAVRWREA